jgi:acyl-CoA thioester hydrolase
MSDFHAVFEMSMPIRWGDMDAFGHVNNTVYFRYMEQVRISWFEELGFVGRNGNGEGPVIVNASMDFLKQLHYPGDVIGRMTVATPGRSSFDTGFELVRADDPTTVYARGAACGSTTQPANRCRCLIGCARSSNAPRWSKRLECQAAARFGLNRRQAAALKAGVSRHPSIPEQAL